MVFRPLGLHFQEPNFQPLVSLESLPRYKNVMSDTVTVTLALSAVAHRQTIADDNGDLIGLSALGTWRQTFRRAAFLNRWAAKPAGKKEEDVLLLNKSFIFYF